MINFDILSDPIANLIGSVILAGVSVTIIAIHKKLTNWFLNTIWNKLSKRYRNSKLNVVEINADVKIREILIELRTITRADRASLFQFHNGSVFSTKNPIWKVSNTHESVAPGISSEIGNLQDIKSSSLVETLQCFWRDTNYPSGVEKLSPKYCSDCPNMDKPHRKRCIFINVDELEEGYSKTLLVEQGIDYLIDAPIFNDMGNCIGFVTVNYCTEQDQETIKKYCKDVCRNASHIEFTLMNRG